MIHTIVFVFDKQRTKSFYVLNLLVDNMLQRLEERTSSSSVNSSTHLKKGPTHRPLYFGNFTKKENKTPLLTNKYG